jgi:hypothetical protein
VYLACILGKNHLPMLPTAMAWAYYIKCSKKIPPTCLFKLGNWQILHPVECTQPYNNHEIIPLNQI